MICYTCGAYFVLDDFLLGCPDCGSEVEVDTEDEDGLDWVKDILGEEE